MNLQIMTNRRQILKYAGLGFATAASTSLLGGCQGLISTSSTSSFKDVMVSIVVDKVFDIFIDFIKNLDIDNEQYFNSWFNGLRRNDQVAVSKVEQMLRDVKLMD